MSEPDKSKEVKAFTDNLSKQAQHLKSKMLSEIAQAVGVILDRNEWNQTIEISFYKLRHSYMNRFDHAASAKDKEQNKLMDEFFEKKSMDEFQSALKDFAWAVENANKSN